MFHVCTNLMGTTSLKNTFYECCVTEAFYDTIMCNSWFTYLRVRREYRHTQSVFRITRNVPFDAPFIFCHVPPNDSIIAAMGSLIEELLSQCRFCIRCLCNHQEPTCVLIYSMHQSYLRVIRVEGRHIFQMPSYSINQCTMKITCSRMHNKPRRLIDNHQNIVFIDNIQRNILCFYRIIMLRTVEHQGDNILWTHLIITLYWHIVHMNITSIGSLLNTVTTGMLHSFKEELIYANRLLTFIYNDTEMLIQLTFPSLIRFSRKEVVIKLILKYRFFFCHHSALFFWSY